MPTLMTTLGPKQANELGMILPHEHVFVDLRLPTHPDHSQANTEDVVARMAPELARARRVGVSAIVECSTLGVGRRADILKAVSLASNFPLVVPTGIYREPWVPAWAHAAEEVELFEWMLGELNGTIAGSGVQAGFIKLSAGDEGLTPCEVKILRAAAHASRLTGAAIGSHTLRGDVALQQLEILEECGCDTRRFIWIHACLEQDFNANLQAALRGAWIEYDLIGDPRDDPRFLSRIQLMLQAGLADRLLLSHDRGWYTPAIPGGGKPKPYTYICEKFIPKLSAAGIDAATLKQLTTLNPFNAFAR
jgi:phosphotriesterase-related protein